MKSSPRLSPRKYSITCFSNLCRADTNTFVSGLGAWALPAHLRLSEKASRPNLETQ